MQYPFRVVAERDGVTREYGCETYNDASELFWAMSYTPKGFDVLLVKEAETGEVRIKKETW